MMDSAMRDMVQDLTNALEGTQHLLESTIEGTSERSVNPGRREMLKRKLKETIDLKWKCQEYLGFFSDKGE